MTNKISKTLKLLFLVAGGFLLYRYTQENKKFAAIPREQLPPGSKPTGKVQRTTTGGPPGMEVSGYGLRDWAEVIVPSGHKQWVEISKSESEAQGA